MMRFKPTPEQDRAVAALLRSRRDFLGLTQAQTARKAGVAHRHYQRFEDCCRSLLTARFKLVPELFNDELPSFTEVTAGRHFDELDPSDAETIRYACADSDYTLRLYHLINGWFDKSLPKHRTVVEQIESPTAVFVGLMKFNGLLVDADRMNARSAECEEHLAKLREEISFIVGDVNIGANASTSAFKQYLYKDLGLPVLKTTAKFQEAADDEAMVLLSEWCEINRPELVPLFKLVQVHHHVALDIAKPYELEEI